MGAKEAAAAYEAAQRGKAGREDCEAVQRAKAARREDGNRPPKGAHGAKFRVKV